MKAWMDCGEGRRVAHKRNRFHWSAIIAVLALPLSGGAAQARDVLVDFEDLKGPSRFSGVDDPVTIDVVTVSGGQILTALEGLVANRTTVYGTANGALCPGCSPVVALDFSEPVSDLSFTLLNGTISNLPYVIIVYDSIDDSGRRQTQWIARQGPIGLAEIEVPGDNVTRVTVQPGLPGGFFHNFYIDDIRFAAPDLGYTVAFSAFVPHDNVPAGPTATCLGRPFELPPGLLVRGVPANSRARWLDDTTAQPAAARGNGSGVTMALTGIPRGRPFGSGGPAGPQALYFAGDNRGFAADAATYRLRQVVTVEPDATLDADGLAEGSVLNLAGEMRAFAADALSGDGMITAEDDDGVANDCHLFHRAYRAETDGMDVTVTRTGPNSVAVRLSGTLDTPMAGPARVLGALDWDLTVTIDKTGDTAHWTVSGAHDGFPAWELYINGVEIYRMDPGEAPYRFSRNLRRLLPPLDAHAGASGTLP